MQYDKILSSSVFSKLSDKTDDIVPVNQNNVILRGCVMRNTDWIEGIVVYGGELGFWGALPV